MSVILLGDGSITSSVALGSLTGTNYLTLNIPAASNPHPQIFENKDTLKGDGGVRIDYKKGRRGLIYQLKIPWVSLAELTFLKRLFEILDTTNWFTLQDHLVYYKSAFAHESVASQKVIIYNTTAFPVSGWIYSKIGLTAFCMTVVSGVNAGLRRRINNQGAYNVSVDPGFTDNIQVGDTFLLGVPVVFTSPPTNRLLNNTPSFEVQLNFEEKIF